MHVLENDAQCPNRTITVVHYIIIIMTTSTINNINVSMYIMGVYCLMGTEFQFGAMRKF